MNDTEVCFFVMRLSYSQIKPEELEALSTFDFQKVVGYIEQRKGLYLHGYIDTLSSSRRKREREGVCQKRFYSESEILIELGFCS